MLMKNLFPILVLVLLIPLFSLAQTPKLDKDIKSQSTKLKEIRKEIDRLNSKISRSQKEEKATIKQIQQLDKQMSMITELKRGLQLERKLKERQIGVIQETISTTDEKISVMKERAARRVVRAYKLGHNRDIDLLLTSGDINQALRRSMYLSAINKAERQTLNELHAMISKNKSSQYNLAHALGEVKRNLDEQKRASLKKASQQQKKESHLSKVRKNKKSWENQKKSKEAAAKEVESKIADLQNKKQEVLRKIARETGKTLEQVKGEFAKHKGKLLWPIQGKVVSRFGPHKHEKLGTVTSNPGIDIAAPKGRDVHVVLDGVVLAITWIPGYGNTIIVGHGDYYTVYAHIDNIQVNLDDYIIRGQTVAQVSDIGSLDGARLHFEVWRGKDKVDPLKWLKR